MKGKARLNGPLSVGAMALFALTSLSANAATDNGTLTVGIRGAGICNGIPNVDIGYHSGIAGSYSPATLTGGRTVSAVFDFRAGGGNCGYSSSLVVSGFTSNPGFGWLTSIRCNGGATLSSGSSSFTYTSSSGEASWIWTGATNQFGFSSGSVTCTIVHS